MSSYYIELLFTAVWLFSSFREFRRPLVFMVKKKTRCVHKKSQLGLVQDSTKCIIYLV